jgi:hypothetical protein
MSKYTELSDWYRFGAPKYGTMVTTKPIEWEVGMKGSGLWLVVPAGTAFDVSVPKLLRWLINPMNPRYFKASAMHDYTLASGWDRVSAAAAFSNGLRADGIGIWTRLTMVIGVIAWNWK